MTYQQFLDQTNLENSLLIGYYGGGNYGDELLLEVLLNVLYQRRVKQAAFVYRNPPKLHDWHGTFPYTPVKSNWQLLKAIGRSRSLVVGGGGLWGMDVNINILILSLLLWLARFCLGKKVYLLGVGYYGSTSRLGRFSAYLAAKAAHLIMARDHETFQRFSRLTKQVHQDTDLAFLLSQIDLSAYDQAAAALAKDLRLGDRMIYVALRQFKDQRASNYHQALEAAIANHPDQTWVVSLLQPAAEFPDGQALLNKWVQKYQHVQMLKTDVNPLAVVRFFQQQAAKFRFITPQFHAIITAMICGIDYLPIVYDNKVRELLQARGVTKWLPLEQLTSTEIENFVNQRA